MTTSPTPKSQFLALVLAAGMLSGCSGMIGRAAPPLLAKREIPGVVLCMSQRTSGGGMRLTGQIEEGNFPITRAAIEYRSANVSDPIPASVSEETKRLELTGTRTETVPYRAGAKDVSFNISPEAMRSLSGKVLWYRWIISYDRGGQRSDVSGIHRASYAEAGLPRDAGAPGPDSSVVLPSSHKR